MLDRIGIERAGFEHLHHVLLGEPGRAEEASRLHDAGHACIQLLELHLAVGDGDTYFLNNAVHLLQKQLEATTAPHSDATFQYGPGMPHCYTGGPSEYTMQENNANWAQRILPVITDHMLATAPAGADVKSWRY